MKISVFLCCKSMPAMLHAMEECVTRQHVLFLPSSFRLSVKKAQVPVWLRRPSKLMVSRLRHVPCSMHVNTAQVRLLAVVIIALVESDDLFVCALPSRFYTREEQDLTCTWSTDLLPNRTCEGHEIREPLYDGLCCFCMLRPLRQPAAHLQRLPGLPGITAVTAWTAKPC